MMGPIDPTPLDALRRYTETYSYDRAGNITELDRFASGNSWTRTFNYETGSNRLEDVTVGSSTDTYSHDVHGNMTAMPHMPTTTGPDIQGMLWSHGDRLERARKGAGAGTYFIYSSMEPMAVG